MVLWNSTRNSKALTGHPGTESVSLIQGQLASISTLPDISPKTEQCELCSPWVRLRPLALCHPSALPGGANPPQGRRGASTRATTQWAKGILSPSRASASQRQKQLLDLGSTGISSRPLHLHGISHTRTCETLLPILSPARHQEDPSPGTNFSPWNSFDPPQLNIVTFNNIKLLLLCQFKIFCEHPLTHSWPCHPHMLHPHSVAFMLISCISI